MELVFFLRGGRCLNSSCVFAVLLDVHLKNIQIISLKMQITNSNREPPIISQTRSQFLDALLRTHSRLKLARTHDLLRLLAAFLLLFALLLQLPDLLLLGFGKLLLLFLLLGQSLFSLSRHKKIGTVSGRWRTRVPRTWRTLQ